MTFRSRFERLLTVAALGALVGAFVLPSADGPIVCPVRLVTGLLCPGCGMTHAFVAMADGRIGDAFAANAFGPLVFVVTAAFVALKVTEVVRGRLLLSRRAIVLLGMLAKPVIVAWIAWAAVRAVA